MSNFVPEHLKERIGSIGYAEKWERLEAEKAHQRELAARMRPPPKHGEEAEHEPLSDESGPGRWVAARDGEPPRRLPKPVEPTQREAIPAEEPAKELDVGLGGLVRITKKLIDSIRQKPADERGPNEEQILASALASERHAAQDKILRDELATPHPFPGNTNLNTLVERGLQAEIERKQRENDARLGPSPHDEDLFEAEAWLESATGPFEELETEYEALRAAVEKSRAERKLLEETIAGKKHLLKEARTEEYIAFYQSKPAPIDADKIEAEIATAQRRLSAVSDRTRDQEQAAADFERERLKPARDERERAENNLIKTKYYLALRREAPLFIAKLKDHLHGIVSQRDYNAARRHLVFALGELLGEELLVSANRL